MERLSLVEVLATIPDPRKPCGRRHPLTAVLSLTAVAILASCKSLEAIAQFGKDHGTALTHALGFTRGDSPTKSGGGLRDNEPEAGGSGRAGVAVASAGALGDRERLALRSDVTLGEDGCRVRTGSSPQVLAALRNEAVHLLEEVDAASKAAATRHFHFHPDEPLLLLFT